MDEKLKELQELPPIVKIGGAVILFGCQALMLVLLTWTWNNHTYPVLAGKPADILDMFFAFVFISCTKSVFTCSSAIRLLLKNL